MCFDVRTNRLEKAESLTMIDSFGELTHHVTPSVRVATARKQSNILYTQPINNITVLHFIELFQLI